MYVSTLKISSKGQIVLPKKIRNILKSNVITLEVNNNNQIVLSPLQDLSGALSDYKQDVDRSFNEIRDHAWQDNIKQRDKSLKGEKR